MIRAKRNKGVTLIELLIVVLILAALSAIAIPRISQSAQNARIRADETNLNLINSAIEQYFQNEGDYPSALSDVTDNDTYFPDGAPTARDGFSFSYSTTTNRASLVSD